MSTLGRAMASVLLISALWFGVQSCTFFSASSAQNVQQPTAAPAQPQDTAAPAATGASTVQGARSAAPTQQLAPGTQDFSTAIRQATDTRKPSSAGQLGVLPVRIHSR